MNATSEENGSIYGRRARPKRIRRTEMSAKYLIAPAITLSAVLCSGAVAAPSPGCVVLSNYGGNADIRTGMVESTAEADNNCGECVVYDLSLYVNGSPDITGEARLEENESKRIAMSFRWDMSGPVTHQLRAKNPRPCQ